MRAHRGSSAVDGGVGFGVAVGVTLIFLPVSYGIGSNVPSIPFRCTPILAFKFDCARIPGGCAGNAFGPKKWLDFHHGCRDLTRREKITENKMRPARPCADPI